MLRAFTCLLSLAGLAIAQSVQAPKPASFDVVSVRPCKAGEGPKDLDFSHGELNLSCLPVKTLIAIAYGRFTDGRWSGIPLDHIEGGPSWIDLDPTYSNDYAIVARGDNAASEEAVRGPMLQAILEDRFQLKLRRETRQVRVYALTADKHSNRLRPFDGTCTLQDVPLQQAPKPPFPKPLCLNSLAGNGNRRIVSMPGTTVFTFASLLSRFAVSRRDLDGPIVDRTGVGGFFDVHLEYGGSGARVAEEPDGLPGLAVAIQEQLGLRLERTVGQDEFLVIEHVERPSAN